MERLDYLHNQIETAIRDCAFSYYWNPFANSIEPLYHFAQTTIYAGVDSNCRIAYITFRGTDSNIDWIRNAVFIPVPVLHPTAHLGFSVTWKFAKSKIFKWLDETSQNYDSIVVTGHSLGGALAMLCAYDLATTEKPLAQCITMGAPRVYWLTSQKKLNNLIGDKVFRLEHPNDLVPKIPPTWLGFRHIGTKVDYTHEFEEILDSHALGNLRKLSGWFAKVSGGTQIEQFINRKLGFVVPLQTIYIIVLGTIGAGGAAILYTAHGIILITTLLLLALTMILTVWSKAPVAHNSGKYAASRVANTLLQEMINVRAYQVALDEGYKLTEYQANSAQVLIHGEIRQIDEDSQLLLSECVHQAFGRAAIESALKIGFVLPSEFGDGSQRYKLFYESAVFLLCVGYSGEEINNFASDFKSKDGIKRPSSWKRYYALEPMTQAKGALTPKFLKDVTSVTNEDEQKLNSNNQTDTCPNDINRTKEIIVSGYALIPLLIGGMFFADAIEGGPNVVPVSVSVSLIIGGVSLLCSWISKSYAGLFGFMASIFLTLVLFRINFEWFEQPTTGFEGIAHILYNQVFGFLNLVGPLIFPSFYLMSDPNS